MHVYILTRSSLAGLGVLMLVFAPRVEAAAQRKVAATSSSKARPIKERVPVLDAQAVGEARRELDNNLLDYPRARFRTVRLVQSSLSFKAFCGDINVTNRMGGYSGWQTFVLPLGKDGVAGLYDKPTISGQPTTMGSFMSKYGEKSSESDIAERQVNAACGPEAKKLDEFDYGEALTFDLKARGQEQSR